MKKPPTLLCWHAVLSCSPRVGVVAQLEADSRSSFLQVASGVPGITDGPGLLSIPEDRQPQSLRSRSSEAFTLPDPSQGVPDSTTLTPMVSSKVPTAIVLLSRCLTTTTGS
jgi:hypothetical protein